MVLLLWCILLTWNSVKASNYRNSDYETRLEALESLTEKYAEIIENQNSEIRNLRSTVVFQKKEIEHLKSETAGLRKNDIFQKEELDVLKELVTFPRGDDYALPKETPPASNVMPSLNTNEKTKTMPGIMAEFVPLHRESRLLSPVPTSTPSTQKSATAFYAYLTHTEHNPGPHHTLIFDKVVTNINNAYNRHSGIFTCDRKGIYGFSFSPRVNCDNYGSFEIMKNSDVLGSVYVHSYNCYSLMSAGSAIVNLDSGDIIYVRTHSTYQMNGDIYSDQYGLPYFNGWLISQL